MRKTQGLECWKEELMSIRRVSEKKKVSEKRREPGKMKVKNMVGRKVMEAILETKDLTKTQLEMDARRHSGTLACSNQHRSW